MVIKKKEMITKKDDYNNVPVDYCTKCLSLLVEEAVFPTTSDRSILKEVPWCKSCESSDIDTIHISEWEKKYEKRHGKKFLDEGDQK